MTRAKIQTDVRVCPKCGARMTVKFRSVDNAELVQFFCQVRHGGCAYVSRQHRITREDFEQYVATRESKHLVAQTA